MSVQLPYGYDWRSTDFCNEVVVTLTKSTEKYSPSDDKVCAVTSCRTRWNLERERSACRRHARQFRLMSPRTRHRRSVFSGFFQAKWRRCCVQLCVESQQWCSLSLRSSAACDPDVVYLFARLKNIICHGNITRDILPQLKSWLAGLHSTKQCVRQFSKCKRPLPTSNVKNQ